MITFQKVMAMLGVSRETLYRWGMSATSTPEEIGVALTAQVKRKSDTIKELRRDVRAINQIVDMVDNEASEVENEQG